MSNSKKHIFIKLLLVVWAHFSVYFGDLLVFDVSTQHTEKEYHPQPQHKFPSLQPLQTSQTLPPPLIIGAGQGTTGTRTLNLAMCRLGFPSLHYLEDCFQTCKLHDSKICTLETADKSMELLLDPRVYYEPYSSSQHASIGSKSNNSTAFTNSMPIRTFGMYSIFKNRETFLELNNNTIPKTFHPHIRLMWMYVDMKECLNPHKESQNYTMKRCPPRGSESDDMEQWAKNIKSLIDEVVRWESSETITTAAADATAYTMATFKLGTVHDTPYPQFLPHLLKSAEKHRGRPPIVINTERDKTEWAARRTYKHPVILCNLDLLTNNHKINTHTHTSHFDWDDCIQRTIRAKRERVLEEGTTVTANNKTTINNNNIKVGLHETFTLYEIVMKNGGKIGGYEWSVDDLLAHIAASYEQYNQFAKQRSVLSWNVFETGTDADSMAREAHEIFMKSGAFPRAIQHFNTHWNKNQTGALNQTHRGEEVPTQ